MFCPSCRIYNVVPQQATVFLKHLFKPPYLQPSKTITKQQQYTHAIKHDTTITQPSKQPSTANVFGLELQKDCNESLSCSPSTDNTVTATLKILPCLAKQSSTAVLTLQSQDSSLTPINPSLISTSLYSPSNTHSTVKCDITQTHQPGEYNITFIPSTRHDQLIVQVGGVDIPDSPFTLPILVIPQMIKEPVNIITGLNEPWGIAVCDNGDIVVAENSAHCITILDNEGKKVRSIGTKGTKEGQFTSPRGVAITNDGHILVTDNHRLQKLTTDGVCVKSFGKYKSGSSQSRFKSPSGIAIHRKTGQVFIADSNNDRIQVFNNDITLSYDIIKYGKNNHFNYPTDVALDNEGYLYVTEWGNNCITKLTRAGRYILQYSSQGCFTNQLNHPSCVNISNNNILYVASDGYISLFDTNGHYLNCFVTTTIVLSSIAINHNTVYTSDNCNNKLIVF